MSNRNPYVHTRIAKIIIAIFLQFICVDVSSQSQLDSFLNKIDPQKLAAVVEKKVSRLNKKIIDKNKATLDKLRAEEIRIYNKLLGSKDSLLARAKLEEINARYDELRKRLPESTSVSTNIQDYSSWLDTTQSVLNFLNNNNVAGNIKSASSTVELFNDRLQQSAAIKQFIRDRKQQLQQQLQTLGLVRELKKFNKEVFYYSEQINEFKEILKDEKKIERKAIELLSKTKVFREFMKRNSILASLFRIPPDDPNDPAYLASLAGLQTRSQVNSLIQNQVASGGANAQSAFQQNLQQAQSQLQELKNKVNKWGLGSSDDIIPDGFRPNNQKTKSFWKRLELGTNVQSQKATNQFPVTSDIGFSIGYKLNDKSIIGIGSSYKLGWGTGWNNLRITHEGVGLRSFIDWKLKGSFWISGGYEQNYKTAIRNIDQLRNLSAWQQGGLIGISKTVSVKNKLFKKTKVQLLWDFLSYRQVPRTQPIVFRIGYNFK